jgi:hypothetical protein
MQSSDDLTRREFVGVTMAAVTLSNAELAVAGLRRSRLAIRWQSMANATISTSIRL